MIYGFDGSTREEPDEIGALTTDIRIRVLNCSASGCLVESVRPLELGTVARLRIIVSGDTFEEIVQVVRCQKILGAGVYHVGTDFLTTTPPCAESLRYLLRREFGRLAGWLQTQPTL